MIKVTKTFNVDTKGEHPVDLSSEEITAFAIWMVEAINNPDVKPLHMQDTTFASRQEGSDLIHFHGQEKGIDLKYARDLVDKVEYLAGKDELLEDVYPGFTEHSANEETQHRYQVSEFKLSDNGGEVLGYVDTDRSQSILPVALKLNEDESEYNYITLNRIPGSPYYGK